MPASTWACSGVGGAAAPAPGAWPSCPALPCASPDPAGAVASGQESPNGWPYGVTTHVTDGTAAIVVSRSVAAAWTAGSLTVPDSGLHTTFTVAVVSASSTPGIWPSSSCAAADSVSGSSNESLYDPPNRAASPPITSAITSHAATALHGRRTAHLDTAPMAVPPGVSCGRTHGPHM